MSRIAFGKKISWQGVTIERIAEARIMIRAVALANAQGCVHDGHRRQQGCQGRNRDDQGCCAEDDLQVIDWAMQAFGGGGTNNDRGIAAAYASARLLRLADGPDEVHRNQIGKIELPRYK